MMSKETSLHRFLENPEKNPILRRAVAKILNNETIQNSLDENNLFGSSQMEVF